MYVNKLVVSERLQRKKLKMEVFTDSKLLIDRIRNKIYHSTKNVMDDNMDVILELKIYILEHSGQSSTNTCPFPPG